MSDDRQSGDDESSSHEELEPNPHNWRSHNSLSWSTVRGLLLVLAAMGLLMDNEALAVAARAFVEIGDAIWGLRNR